MSLDELLQQLHGELAKEFLRRIREGEAKPADLSAARQFLKDNGVESVPSEGTDLSELAGEVPTFEDEDEPNIKIA